MSQKKKNRIKIKRWLIDLERTKVHCVWSEKDVSDFMKNRSNYSIYKWNKFIAVNVKRVYK